MWTKDERIAALLPEVMQHYKDHDEFSLEHEGQMEEIREDHIENLWYEYTAEYGTESDDGFDEWHGQPTVEQFITERIKKYDADNAPIGADPKTRRMIEDAYYGSKNLCAAILATGKAHGPMTPEQQTAAIEYAHSVRLTEYGMVSTPNIAPRTLRLTDWNLKK